MKNARIIKELIDNNVITKSERKLVGASIARPHSKEYTIAGVGAILIAHRPQRNCLKHKQSGVTLIALIITIIILLILTSITMNLTLGERGIFNTAKKAVQNYKEAEENEFMELNNFQQEAWNTINGIENNSNMEDKDTETGNITQQPEILYLYNGGNECIDITGGWEGYSAGSTQWSTATPTIPTIIKDSSSMTVQLTNYASIGQVKTKKMINISEYNKIYVEYSGTAGAYSSATINLSNKLNFTNGEDGNIDSLGLLTSYDNIQNSIEYLDISSIKIDVCIYICENCTENVTLKINKIWLEK